MADPIGGADVGSAASVGGDIIGAAFNGLNILPTAIGSAPVATLDAVGTLVQVPYSPIMVLGGLALSLGPRQPMEVSELPRWIEVPRPGGWPGRQMMGWQAPVIRLRGHLYGLTAIDELNTLRSMNGTMQSFSYGPYQALNVAVTLEPHQYYRDDSIEYALTLTLLSPVTLTPPPAPVATTAPAQAQGQEPTLNPAESDRPTTSYTVVLGDTLWGIAQKLYGDGSLWIVIYRDNTDIIGSDPDLIIPGQSLTVPTDANAARTRLASQEGEFAALPSS